MPSAASILTKCAAFMTRGKISRAEHKNVVVSNFSLLYSAHKSCKASSHWSVGDSNELDNFGDLEMFERFWKFV